MTTHQTVDTVVVGAGHAGLAVSRLLTDAGRDHVVLDRGRIAERWRTERWDSLRLLTPTWMTRLPGWYPGGRDPEGFLSAAELTTYLERYAASFDAPIHAGTNVRRVAPARGGVGYDVRTDTGTWRTRHVVVATGPHGPNRVPVPLADLRAAELVPSSRYRNPGQLADGGVLVVGASASGVQIADELARAGREVTLAVGRHTRVPRRYRGLDLFWWLESTGRLGRTIDDVTEPLRARHEPSLQLVGRAERSDASDLDLSTLSQRGVRLVGRLQGLDGDRVALDDGLRARTVEADRALCRLLGSLDEYAARTGLARELLAPTRPRPVDPAPAPGWLDLRAERIGTIVLAAGHRPDHSWLALPVTGPDGAIRQYRGVTSAPGIYVVGQRFQHRRDSSFIDGARHDARDVVTHLVTGALPAAAVASEEPAA
ncbi:SidA/IucD/PvdA family monooxygenase [Nocardioides sp. MAH-18]|uniref:SidA/IucD/PvdA family monooxygenase n=1 Tax=Nocardioides agri TaxID=2682843 RepID=A0A6L6XMN7_9ACTN|nr:MULTISPECIES: NAD(P)/FAD-dependent oxidoreductase [unclassified Nocardioides]MBA2953340.1 NAD(P)-binding domain-containing protein [Nocardioides sp. CGMCC 1.13656]MVQ48208.1 SidA/IucD/PvdA family monooxygenase [Nocardioides sp. MAH-18]